MKLTKRDVFTIPNLLSLLRFMMIPMFATLYLQGEDGWTAAVLMLSGTTDALDGYIARRYNQASDFGKVFDPFADKLTQAAMLLCLTTRYPAMFLPFVLLVLKECVAAVSGILVIRRTGVVPGAEWHGKIATMLLYGMMIMHVLWKDIPVWLSNTMNIGCVVMMLISLGFYTKRNLSQIRSNPNL